MFCPKSMHKLQMSRWSWKLGDNPYLANLYSRGRAQCPLHTDTENAEHDQSSVGDTNIHIKTKTLPVALHYFADECKLANRRSQSSFGNSMKGIAENLEDIKSEIEELKVMKRKYLVCQKETSKENKDPEYSTKSMLIGTPDKNCKPSKVPCGGCGALLHCSDPAIPGYIPQQKFKGLKEENLAKLLCKRCTLLHSSNMLVPVPMDIDQNTYKKVIKKIKKEKALVVMIVDVTDITNSIIPEFLHKIGKSRPIFIVGNKIDLIPKDAKGHLNGILHRLEKECERVSLNPSGRNIRYTCLVSAKTGFGIEELINKLLNFWDVDGNVYLVGTTNSGKSTLFNKFLESDYCKHTCRDIVQRATVSRWPGTTLNLIKFPIIKAQKWRMFLRTMRIKEDNVKDSDKLEWRKEKLKVHGGSHYATLFGNVGKTEFRKEEKVDKDNMKYETTGHQFTAYSFDKDTEDIQTGDIFNKSSVLDLRTTVLEDMYPDSKWTCDTPGLVNPSQIINSLTAEELKRILKREMIRPRVYVVKPGDVMFITGLARIDYLEGDIQTFFTVHTNHFLPVHVVRSDQAEDFYAENIGTDTLGIPVGDPERVSRLPSLCGREFFIETEEHRFASTDLQLSSLGWVSFAGYNKHIHIRAYTPAGRGMHLRTPALLPNIAAFKGERIGGTKQYVVRKLKI